MLDLIDFSVGLGRETTLTSSDLRLTTTYIQTGMSKFWLLSLMPRPHPVQFFHRRDAMRPDASAMYKVNLSPSLQDTRRCSFYNHPLLQ